MNEGQIPPVLCQSFHENCWIFKVFERTGTGSSLILKFSQTNQPAVLEYVKEPTQVVL
jgi:hypothetical protein